MLTLLALYEMKSGRIDPSRFLCLAALGLISACGPRSSTAAPHAGTKMSSLFARADERFTPQLVAPGRTIHGVCVNIRQAELVLEHKDETLQIGLGHQFGMVDLLSLSNILLEAIYDVYVPEGSRVCQVRLSLEPDGHYILSGDEARRDFLPRSYDPRGLEMIVKEVVSGRRGTRYTVAVQANTPARWARPSALAFPARVGTAA